MPRWQARARSTRPSPPASKSSAAAPARSVPPCPPTTSCANARSKRRSPNSTRPRHQTPPTRPRSRAPSRPQRPCPAGLVGFLPSRAPRPRLSSSSAPSPCCNATTRARPTPRRSRSRHPLPGRASLRRRRLASPRRARTRRARRPRHRTRPCPPSEISARSPATTSCARPSAPEQFTSTAANAALPTPAKPRYERPSSGELGELAGSVTLRFEEQPARALVFIDADGTDHIVVVADQTCEVLDQVD